MNFQQRDDFLDTEQYYTLKSYLNKFSESSQLGIWEFDLVNSPELTEWKAINIFELLGYHIYNHKFNFDYFLNRIVHREDYYIALNFFEDDVRNLINPAIEVRLLTKSTGWRWFSITGKGWWNDDGDLQQLIGILVNIDQQKRAALALNRNESLLNDMARSLEAGAWETNLTTRAIQWTKEIYKLLELPQHFKPTIDNTKPFYKPECYSAMRDAFKEAIEKQAAFNIEVCLITASQKTVWVQLKGQAHRAESIVKGSIQKIEKAGDTDLLNTNKQLVEQNKRLQNFAHIVSHNLRSYSNNLQAMMTMINQPNTMPQDREDCMKYVQAISAGLSNTVNHLAEIVKQQNDADKKKSIINFEETLANITSALKSDLENINGHIDADFSAAPAIEYLPAYLDSIFLNMVTNAIKYRHPGRDLQFRVRSYQSNGHIYLTFEDNGLGIDLSQHKEQLFGMYKTFHQHPDSRGLGLFMTRNQIETLGGHIDVESTVGAGTKFIIRLN